MILRPDHTGYLMGRVDGACRPVPPNQRDAVPPFGLGRSMAGLSEALACTLRALVRPAEGSGGVATAIYLVLR